MELNEVTAVASAELPVSALSAHLHLGTGFSDDGSHDAVLESYLRAALSTIESRTGKAVLQRPFVWTLYQWNSGGRQGLPIAPVVQITSLKTITRDGAETIADPASYGLFRDRQRPCVVASSGQFPAIQNGGQAEFAFDAGYGATWAEVPPDLQQAVLLMAAHYFENRYGQANGNDLPASVLALIEAYRPLRLSGRVA